MMPRTLRYACSSIYEIEEAEAEADAALEGSDVSAKQSITTPSPLAYISSHRE